MVRVGWLGGEGRNVGRSGRRDMEGVVRPCASCSALLTHSSCSHSLSLSHASLLNSTTT